MARHKHQNKGEEATEPTLMEEPEAAVVETAPEEAAILQEAMAAFEEAVEEKAMEEPAPVPAPPAPFVTAGFVVVRPLRDIEWVRMGNSSYQLKEGKELEMLEGHAQELESVGVVTIVK
jgi:hypothetical protein